MPVPPSRPWYEDPVGVSLLSAGTACLAVGATFLLSARAADQARADADNHFEFADARDRAETRGTIAVVTLAAGAALLGGGLAWYALAPDRTEGDSISLWMDEASTTLILSGRF